MSCGPGDILGTSWGLPANPSRMGSQLLPCGSGMGVSHGVAPPPAPHPSSFTHQEHPVCFQTLPARLSGRLGLALFSVTPIDVSGVALVESGEEFGSSWFYSPSPLSFFSPVWQRRGWAQPSAWLVPGSCRRWGESCSSAAPAAWHGFAASDPISAQNRSVLLSASSLPLCSL